MYTYSSMHFKIVTYKLQCIISRGFSIFFHNSSPPWSLLLLSAFDGRLCSTKNEGKNEDSWRISSTEWWWMLTSGKVYRIVVHFSPEAQQHSCIYMSFDYSWNDFTAPCEGRVAYESKHEGEKYRERKSYSCLISRAVEESRWSMYPWTK